MKDEFKLRNAITKLVTKFKDEKAWQRKEEHIQTFFTTKLLELIGFGSANIIINEGPDVKTGKRPDILLLDNNSNTLLVIESKEASKSNILDGRYNNKTFVEQLDGYCNAEGIYWGVLTNFIEWRIYSIYQNRLYKEKKYAFHELLWNNANKDEYIDLVSEEGLDFFIKLSKDKLIECRGHLDDDTVYYPKQEEIKQNFFEKLKLWRTTLRSYIRNVNKDKYTLENIDIMTQKILDRLIFIDYCSDNSVLSQDKLHAIMHSREDKWKELKRIFSEMDEKFNSELFAQHDCDNLKIDDETIVPIIKELSAIDFKRLSVHIIGEVYENYLGEILKKSRSGISVEEDKAVNKKKSQGIYYTPDFIVNYIVENTVGQLLLNCKTEKEIENIRILDPACGSGSFLICVFNEFLKNYKRVNNEGKLFEFEIRKKILQKNIFGVDLDEKAVEIAKLNLMIKALEGLNWQNIEGRKLLPTLKLNIRCGNSLVSGNFDIDNPDSFNNEHKEILSSLLELHKKFQNAKEDQDKESIYTAILVNEERINRNVNKELSYLKDIDKLRPFNYPVAFPEIFINGGFDCVIGNPPYVGQKNNKDLFEPFKTGYWKEFYERKQDMYYYFFMKGNKILKEKGLLSFITPQYWLNATAAKKLRNNLSNSMSLKSIFDVSNTKVFAKANINTMVFIFEKNKSKSKIQIKYLENELIKSYNSIITNASLNENEWNLFKTKDYINLSKGKIDYLGDICTISPGIQTGCDKVSNSHLSKLKSVTDLKKDQGIYVINDLEIKSFSKESRSFIKPWYKNSDINRYQHNIKNTSWVLITNTIDDIKKYTDIEQHLLKFKKIIDKRYKNFALKKAYQDNRWWYLYGYRPDTDFESEKIIFPYRGAKPSFSYSMEPYYGSIDIYYITTLINKYDYKFILGILNSKAIHFYLDKNCKKKGDIFEFYTQPMSKIPIPSTNKKEQDEIIKLVNERISLSKSDNKNQTISVKIKAIEEDIDNKVYQLFNLSKEEKELIDSFIK